MRKYIAVAKILFKAQLAYRFDVIMTALSSIWRVIFAWVLWGAIFSGRAAVGGFTLETMLTYYVITSFLTVADLSGTLGFEVSDRIRGGSFSKYMVIPASPLLYFISQTLGASGYYGIFAALAAATGAIAFRIRPAIASNPAAILLAAALYLTGVVFMNCFNYFIGLWAFKFQEVGFILHLIPNVTSFLSGEYVPLSLLPPAFAPALRCLPFMHVVYTPAMLLMGETGLADGLFGLAVIAAWALAMALTCRATYNGLRVKYEGVGI